MKRQVTQKYIKAVFDNVLQVGYCGAQFLLWDVSPFAYNCGVYGWNCDYYILDDFVICTGYRPHGKNINDITARFEQLANYAYHCRDVEYDFRIEMIREIRKDWIREIKKALEM